LTQPLPDPRLHEPSLSEGLCRVLRKMMAKDREERYPNVYVLDRDLYRMQIGERPEADEPSVSGITTLIRSEPMETPPAARATSRSAAGVTPAPARIETRSRTGIP